MGLDKMSERNWGSARKLADVVRYRKTRRTLQGDGLGHQMVGPAHIGFALPGGTGDQFGTPCFGCQFFVTDPFANDVGDRLSDLRISHPFTSARDDHAL